MGLLRAREIGTHLRGRCSHFRNACLDHVAPLRSSFMILWLMELSYSFHNEPHPGGSIPRKFVTVSLSSISASIPVRLIVPHLLAEHRIASSWSS